MTLDKAWIDLGAPEKCIALAYVSVSRVRKLNGMVIEPITFERLQAVKKSKDFEFRKIEEEYLTKLAEMALLD